MPEPFLVLVDRYIPSKWRPRVIGRELTQMMDHMGIVPHPDPIHGPIHWRRGWYNDTLHAEVRRITLPAPAAGDWHKDGDTTPGSKMDCAIVVWANRAPTEFEWAGQVYQPKPFQVVISRNLLCPHRRPSDAPSRRWFYRQRVKVPTHLAIP